MKTIARGSFILLFLLSMLGCALLYVGSCVFSIEQTPCIQRGDLINFVETHFAVFAKIQGALVSGAFLVLMLFMASGSQHRDDPLFSLLPWRWMEGVFAELPARNKWLRWLSLFEKRDPGGVFA